MDIVRAGSQPSTRQPAANATGDARRDMLIQAAAPSRLVAGSVSFAPGARTAWHTHPLGQLLIVTSGCGWVQSWGGPKTEVRPGDAIWFAAGEKHWHGATASDAMTHLAIVEHLDGVAADWMEHVTEAEYQA